MLRPAMGVLVGRQLPMDRVAGGLAALCRLGSVGILVLLLAGCDFIHQDNYKPVAEVQPTFSDRTILYYTPGVGRQVEFYSAEGKAHLWVSRNQGVLHGEWRISDETLGNSLCTRYEPFKYNPITGVDGSRWGCTLLSMIRNSTLDEVPGDPLALARRNRLPFTLSALKHVDTVEEIRKSLPALP
jgi:hypothetical protein